MLWLIKGLIVYQKNFYINFKEESIKLSKINIILFMMF